MSGSISNLGQLGQIILSGSSLNSQIFNVNIKDLVDEISEIKGLMDDLNVNASEAISIARNAQKMVEDGFLNLTANTSDFTEVKEMAERAMGIASNIDIKITDINREIDDLQTINENFNEEILEPFRDGIITEAEALSIKKYLNTIEQNFGEVKTAFNCIKTNEYLTVSAKEQLGNYYNRVEAEKTNLVNIINEVIPSGVTQDEIALVNAKFESYNNSLFDFRRELEIANTVIQNQIKDITEDNMRAYSDEKVAVATEAAEIAKAEAETAKLSAIEAQSYAESVNEAAKNAVIEAEKAISRLDKIDDDSVIAPSEKTSLKQQLAQINSDYEEIDGNVKKYAEFYSDGDDKTTFEDYKTAYNKAKITLGYYTLDEVEDANGELSKYIKIITEEGNTYNFNNIAKYYEKRQLMYNSLCDVANRYSVKVSNVAKNEALEYADTEALKVKALADAAQLSANQAKQEAEDAMNNAAKAQEQLNKMDDDNFISPVEKNALIQQAAVISSDIDEVIEDLIEYDINSGETPAFISFFDAAGKALAAIEYHAQDFVIITDENGKQVETKHIPIQKSGDYNFGYINDYYPARQAMLNQISKITREHAEKVAADAKNEAMQLSDSKIEELQSTMVTVDNITDAIDRKINDSFVDGIISEAEAKAISLEVNNINSTFTQLQSQYTIINEDNFILGQINNEASLTDKPFTNAKAELKDAFDSLETCKDTLVDTITNVISDKVVSGEENESYQNAFTSFDEAIVLFNNKLKAVDDLVLSENLAITRTDLQQAYTDYVSAELASSSAATLAMADGKITDAEMRAIQSAQTIANEAYTAAVKASESRISELGNRVDTAVGDLANANEKINEAKAAAQAAQTYAINIQKDLDLIGNDDYVTPSEKIVIKQQLTEIGANHNEILSNIELYKTNGIYKETGEDYKLVELYKETYRKAINAIQFFTTTTVKNIPLSSYTQGSYSDINDYYDKRQLMLNKITLWSDDYADAKAEEAKDAATSMLEETTSILNSQLETYTKDLNDISALTQSARSEAETALQKLNDIDNDSVITPSEKKVLDIQLNSIKSKYLEITDEARQYKFDTNADYLSYVGCANEVISTLETILVKDKWNENFNLTGDMVTKYNNISNYYTEEAKVLSSLTQVMQSYVDTTVDNLSTATNELIHQFSADVYSYAAEVAEDKAMEAMQNANENLANANKAIEDAKAAAKEAQEAAADASKANEELINFKSDKKITPPEKRNLSVLLKQIIEDKKNIEKDCGIYGITDKINNVTLKEYLASYDKSVDILDYILKDTEEFFDIDRTTTKGSKYSDIELYYEKRQALLDLISTELNEKAETLASEAKASAIASATSMTNLISATIEEVSGTANSMLNLLNEFDNDDVITINELPSLKFELSNIISRYNENLKYAGLYGLSGSTQFNTYKTAYDKAVSALTYHTSGVTSEKSTAIIKTGNCSYSNISGYYGSELTLLEFIDGKAKSHVSEQAYSAITEAKSYAETKVREINTALTQNIENINTNMQNNIASIKKNLDGDGIITVAEKKALIREWETLKGSSGINETIIGTTGNAGNLYKKANELKIDTDKLGLLTAICKSISTALSKIGLYNTGATTLNDADKYIANVINDEFISYYKVEAEINTLIAKAEAENAKTQAISDAESKIATAKTALETNINDAKNKAISAQTAANNAQAAATNAQTAATNAQTAANNAKSRLDDIDNDGKVTASEKKQLKTQLSQIKANYKEITGTTGKYNITTGNNTTYKNYVTSYTAAYSAFDSMALTSTATTSVNTSAFTTINNYYDYESAIYNEISNQAKLYAEEEAKRASGAAKNYTDTIKESLSGTISGINIELSGKIESIDSSLTSSITELRNNFNDDNIITVSEKKTLKREWGEIAGITSFTKVISASSGSAINVYNKLKGLSLTSDANDISNAYDEIRRVLSGISLYDTGSTKLKDTTIDDKITTALTNYYQVEAKLLTKIAETEATNAKNNAISAANNSLNTAKGELNASITAVNKSLTAATGSLSSSIASVDTNLKSATGTLNSSITSVNKSLTAATGVLSTTTGTLKSATGTLSTATGNISTLQTNVSKLQEITGQLQTNINNLDKNFNTDNIITVTEKKSLRIEWEKIAGVTNVSSSTLITNSFGSGNQVYNKLNTLGLSTTNLTTAFNNVRNSFSGIGLYDNTSYTGSNASTSSNNIKASLTKYYVAESESNIAIANQEAANAKSQAITSANSSLSSASGKLSTNITTATTSLNTSINNKTSKSALTNTLFTTDSINVKNTITLGTNVNAGMCGSGTSGSEIRLWVGDTNKNKAPFRVEDNGACHASIFYGSMMSENISYNELICGTYKDSEGIVNILNLLNMMIAIHPTTYGISGTSEGNRVCSTILNNQLGKFLDVFKTYDVDTEYDNLSYEYEFPNAIGYIDLNTLPNLTKMIDNLFGVPETKKIISIPTNCDKYYVTNLPIISEFSGSSILSGYSYIDAILVNNLFDRNREVTLEFEKPVILKLAGDYAQPHLMSRAKNGYLRRNEYTPAFRMVTGTVTSSTTSVTSSVTSDNKVEFTLKTTTASTNNGELGKKSRLLNFNPSFYVGFNEYYTFLRSNTMIDGIDSNISYLFEPRYSNSYTNLVSAVSSLSFEDSPVNPNIINYLANSLSGDDVIEKLGEMLYEEGIIICNSITLRSISDITHSGYGYCKTIPSIKIKNLRKHKYGHSVMSTVHGGDKLVAGITHQTNYRTENETGMLYQNSVPYNYLSKYYTYLDAYADYYNIKCFGNTLKKTNNLSFLNIFNDTTKYNKFKASNSKYTGLWGIFEYYYQKFIDVKQNLLTNGQILLVNDKKSININSTSIHSSWNVVSFTLNDNNIA